MPTADRRRFVAQAIWYFLRQDYPARELIILDDGADAIGDLVPSDERIRYVRLPQRMPLGAKRNLACELSNGPFIAHWDDDDWIASHRLSLQVAQLQATGADVCGARDLLHYRLHAGDAWLYRYPPGGRAWVAGCTLLYRRDAWAAHPFPTLNVGEDSAFVWQLPAERVHAIPDQDWYVALIHNRNTATKNLTDRRWERQPLGAVSDLIAVDRDFYVTLRNNGHAPRPRTKIGSLTLGALFGVDTGYGSMAEYLALGLARAGINVNVVPLSLHPDGLTGEFQALWRRSRPEPGAPALFFCWPRPELEHFRAASDLFINTMWENSRMPASWVAPLNRTRAVIVPSRFLVDSARACGVTVPLEVIPEGIDPDVYHWEERPPRPGVTTLMVGPVDARKHSLVGIAAWKQVFANDPDARLIIKTSYNFGNYTPDDPRIALVERGEHTRGIAHWYRRADVLLALGNEGFGLPLVEGMATGLPVIALNSEGQADICADAHECVLPVPPATWDRWHATPSEPASVRGVPDVADVARHLRWVREHRDEAQDIGRAAAAWVQQQRNIWTKGPAVADVIERYLQPARPLRRAYTLWVPSWQTPCGIAEYSAHLASALPAIKVSAQQPDWRGVRVAHVQHEHGLFNATQFAQQIVAARHAHVPVVVTEHTVTNEAQAWEHAADALVALTERGTAMLRARWPDKRIELLPPGCPTWFPPRKHTRGRTIAVFGFLAPHKGFWHLLDVLRAVPGTELLMFSHARHPYWEERWQEVIRGLPVRRIDEFLPIDQIAQRLAAEADLLAFWYDDIPHASASYAVRIGLATGVPVLASPTGWFRELHHVAYQPPDLIAGVQRLLDDTALRDQLSAAAHTYCHDHSWRRIAERHQALWHSMEH